MRRLAVVLLGVFSIAGTGAQAADPIQLRPVIRVVKPGFPAPLSQLRPTGAIRLTQVSLARRAPVVVSQTEPKPSWADLVAALVDAPFVRGSSQPGTTIAIYGTRFVVGVGPHERIKYVIDLRSFGFPPKSLVPKAYGPQEVSWARQIGRTLVVQTNHLGYAADSGGRNGYLTGIDLDTGKVRWRSPALVANAQNFVVVRGLIVSGYGFTAEKDWLYLVDPATGRVRDRLALPSMAERIAVQGDRIVVRCYDARVLARLVPA